MSETICTINSKICQFNDNGYCIATDEQITEIFDKGFCSNQGRY